MQALMLRHQGPATACSFELNLKFTSMSMTYVDSFVHISILSNCLKLLHRICVEQHCGPL